MIEKEPEITVLGVGNILLSDEGVGVHVVRQLQENFNFSPAVTLLDGGTMGMELLTYMRGTKRLILVDAVDGDGEPGTVYRFFHEETENYFTGSISVHEVGMQDILRIRALQEDPLDEAVVIGVQPASMDLGLELTDTVETVVPTLIQAVCEVLTSWQVEVTPKHG